MVLAKRIDMEKMYRGQRLEQLKSKISLYEEYVKKIQSLKAEIYESRGNGDEIERILQTLFRKHSFFIRPREPIPCIEAFREALARADAALTEAEKMIDESVACEFLEKDKLMSLCGEPLEKWLTCDNAPARQLAVEVQRRASEPQPPPKSENDEPPF